MRYNLISMLTLILWSAPILISGISSSTQESFKNKNDSLLNVIRSTANDTDKTMLYIDLCDLNTYNNSKKAVEYAKQAVYTANQADYYLGIAKGYERAANAYFQLGDHERATAYYLKAGDANKKAGNYQLDASVNYNLGNIQHELGNYDSAIYYAQEAGKIFKANNDSMGYGASLYLVSSEYQSKGNYELATANILQALEIFRNKGVKEWEVYALNMLVGIYNVQKKYNESLALLNTCLRYHQKNNNAKFTAITYRLIGDIYLEIPDYERARVNLDSSYQITVANGFAQEEIKSMYSLGQLAFRTKNYEKALKIYQSGLKLSYKWDDALFKCSNYFGIGECFSEQKKYHAAIDNLEQSILHAQNIEDNYKLRDAYEIISRNYEALNNPQMALSNFKKYKQFSDSIHAKENKRQFAELTSKYETEKKEKQITVLQKENAKAESNQQRVLFFWILTLVVGVLVVTILVQAYRKNKQLLRAEKELDQVKSRFFANISHEFRTPLTLILGPVSEMLKNKASEPFQPSLHTVKQQANRLLLLINQILDLSKLDSGKYSLRIIQGDFVAMFKSTVLSFHSLAETKNIHLEIECEKEQWMIHYDPESVATILNNILSNAFKFEPHNGHVKVQLDSSGSDANQLSIAITNSGSFIPEKDCALIFDRFYGSTHTFSQGKGTGIGLALTKELVNMHQGSIQVKSTRETGTCFTLLLPTNLPVTEQNMAITPIRPNGKEHKPNGKKLTVPSEISQTNSLPLILVIEDHQEVSEYIVSILENKYQIITASNGREGVDKALLFIPDIIVSDVMMPEMNGIEVVQSLKSNELSSHIPMILLTAKASVDDRIEGLEVKADAYLTKPFNADELRLLIHNMLDHRNKLKEKYSDELVINTANIQVKSLDQVFMTRICQAIEDNLSNENFSVEELAGIIGLSRSQLHRKLEAVTAKSTSRFIREYKLERAKELILKNTGTISEIAFMTGFKNMGYFNKSFKNYFNTTPGQLKENTDIL
ncbi:hybrid sensor histidine kinase/response regulator transcription factor [Saccharicrinis sp. 156]|uniref:hybrid sensor histidine kinase/response regulator transcription factor n=1 Tax=Saccharicrinis sp. 156 TaxID=3417574 RepID=UPI003D336D17